ncbi:nitroreductase family protein [Flavobacterium crassostreae]|uniref:NAD(P)H-dependent oxidoreductase n=1 Tax=Flavobacterium crassostreae TaxID=1763534 RepID=A0A1B9E996_9FLAO|nr:nitroreductase family protein [Flavobacterium crassostreae]OCB78515.1 NAD(P)H-dependent oxidoreductase [Flavobacterium crassostreae]
MNLLENLNWRHAVKAYKANKKVSQENIDKIVEAARLAPSSSGLQPFQLVVIENQEIKEKLALTALNPDCMRNCSHVIIFAAWDRYTAERIDKVYDHTTEVRGLPKGRFESYTDQLKASYLKQPAEENFAHTARQSYIALGLALAQAAELRIDSTPVEGFDNAVTDEILGLQSHGLKSVSLMYVGYADTANDWIAPMKKVRTPKKEFLIEFK